MSTKFECFLSYLGRQEFKTPNEKMKQVVDDYSFLEISKQRELENIKNTESRIIVISHYVEQKTGKDDHYFVVSFKRTIFVINQSRINILQNFLSKNEKLEICFLFDTKKIFDEINSKENEIKINYSETKNDEYFEDDIKVINSNFFKIQFQKFPYNDIFFIIKSSISGYLLKQSYYSYDRMDNFNNKANNTNKPKEIKEEDILELRVIGKGTQSNVILYYYIEYEKLVVIKKYSSDNPEREKLLKREMRNYEEFSHPFIPKFYGKIKYGNQFYPVIEFINGFTLFSYNNFLKETEIYEIIFQILLVFNYLHINHFIYRDLKPNNVIIDQNKMLILIDFDRVIKYNEDSETKDFSSSYVDPEVNSIEFNNSNKCDILSIGKIIYFLLTEKQLSIENYKDTELYQIYELCIISDAKSRPNTTELINYFITFNKKYKISIDKTIYYYTLAANQNHSFALFNLGLIYEKGKYIPRDINKAIYYYSLAANQNHSHSQYNLGLIYEEGKYIPRDINKAIYYFSLAANQNDSNAQYNLGVLYAAGKYIPRDINKAIYYFSLAADQNDSNAQYNLGIIYAKDQYISRNINKAIYYFSLAANQNDSYAQYNLGVLYTTDQYISRDINNAIYYFSLAANQNHSQAQYNLGLIYEEGKYIPHDINKAIYYFSLAANQNIPQAQYNLGLIYEERKYISRDINKAIQKYMMKRYLNDFMKSINQLILYIIIHLNQLNQKNYLFK